MAAQLLTPTSRVWESRCSTAFEISGIGSLLNFRLCFCVWCFLNDVFKFFIPDDCWGWEPIQIFTGYLHVFSLDMAIKFSVLFLFFYGINYLILSDRSEFLHVLSKSYFPLNVLQLSSATLDLICFSLYGVFGWIEVLNFNVVQFIIYFY